MPKTYNKHCADRRRASEDDDTLVFACCKTAQHCRFGHQTGTYRADQNISNTLQKDKDGVRSEYRRGIVTNCTAHGHSHGGETEAEEAIYETERYE